jgi:hypothetical protein
MNKTAGFFPLLDGYRPYEELKEAIRATKPNITSVTGLTDGAKAHIITALILSEKRPAFLMVKNRKEAEKLKENS